MRQVILLCQNSYHSVYMYTNCGLWCGSVQINWCEEIFNLQGNHEVKLSWHVFYGESHRERNVPGAVCAEGPAAPLTGKLLPLLWLSDNPTLQQGGGVDHLQQTDLHFLQTGVCLWKKKNSKYNCGRHFHGVRHRHAASQTPVTATSELQQVFL